MTLLHSTVHGSRGDARKGAILLVDSEPFWQGCLAEALRGAFPDLTVLVSSDVEEARQLDPALLAMVLLKVGTMPEAEGALGQAVHTIGTHFPHTPVVVISMREDAAIVKAAVMAGARGVVPFAAPLQTALAALRLIMAGGACFSYPAGDSRALPDGSSDVPFGTVRHAHPAGWQADETDSSHEATDAAVDGACTRFTAREAEVLAALQIGRPNKWIAHHLNLSENTVKFYVKQIMRKLRATNRTEAVIASQNLRCIVHPGSAGRLGPVQSGPAGGPGPADDENLVHRAGQQVGPNRSDPTGRAGGEWRRLATRYDALVQEPSLGPASRDRAPFGLDILANDLGSPQETLKAHIRYLVESDHSLRH